ncbi:hypothetical protein, partial [Thiorhodovibrio winogradskyi]|uniref:hypothetical protein n=1 Tax=Thiorhodovibrio winogradskyi TaxID=77007 RepID=UPI001911F7B2
MKKKTLPPPPPGRAHCDQLFDQARASTDPGEVLALTEQLLKRDPLHTRGLALRTRTLKQQGKASAALDLAYKLCLQDPSPEHLLLLAELAARRGRLTDALSAAARCLAEDHKNPSALNWVAGLYGTLKLDDLSRHWAKQAAVASPLSHSPSRAGARLRLLVLGTKASGSFMYNPQNGQFQTTEGHNNLSSLLDGQHVTRYHLSIDAFENNPGLLQQLPRVDLIYNSITDADRCQHALQLADQLCAKLERPVINPPAAVLHSTREANHQRFQDHPDIILPKAVCLGECCGPLGERIRQAASDHGLSAPLIMRAGGFQGGKHMHKIDRLDTLEVALQQPTDVYLIQYHEVSHSDERAPGQRLYPKYRAFFVGGTLFPAHCFVAADFNVHKKNADPLLRQHPWLAEIERDYLSDPATHIGPARWQALETAMRQLNLDYGGVDFAPATSAAEQGKVVVFEANAAMRNWIDQLTEGDPVQQAWQQITEAAHRHFCHRAGVEPWEFALPAGKPGVPQCPEDVCCLPKAPQPDHAATNHRWLAERLGESNDFSDAPFFDTRHFIDEELLEQTARAQGIAVKRRAGRMLEFTQAHKQLVFHINAPRIPMAVHVLERDKVLVKQLLAQQGLPTPTGQAFTDFQPAYAYFAAQSRPQPTFNNWSQNYLDFQQDKCTQISVTALHLRFCRRCCSFRSKSAVVHPGDHSRPRHRKWLAGAAPPLW